MPVGADSPDRADGRAHLAWRCVAVWAFAWVFAATYHPLLPAADADLDGGYAQALGVALLRGLVFGRDVVFTYGPLGAFWVPLYQPELFGWHFVWELVFKSMQALVVVRAAFAWPRPVSRALVLGCVVASVGVSHDATACAAIVAGVLLLARRPAPGAAFASVAVFVCALLSLQKFTLLLLSCVAFVTLGVALAAQRRGREAVALPLGFVLAGTATWVAIGQPVGALADFAQGSWQLASGYSQAMSTGYDPAEQDLALAALALGVALVAAGVARCRTASQAALSVLVVAALFVTWKAGFVRSAAHTKITFAFALLSPLWIAAMPALDDRLRRWGAAILVVLGIAGFSQTDPSFEWARSAGRRPMGTWLELSAPFEARARLEQALAESRRDLAIPRIRERVAGDSIDVLPWSMGVLLLHDFDWQPRPVFQSYAAYTPTLVERNADHFRSPGRPRFVLAHGGTIDRRPPMHDDGEAWIEILRRYEPVIYENGFLLFELRTPVPAPGAARLLAERTIRPGEPLDLSGLVGDVCYVELEIELDQTLLGRLRAMLYRGAQVHLDTHFGDEVLVRHRIVPGVTERGFLVAPAADGIVSWLFHFEGVVLEKPTSIALDIRPRDRKWFAPTATLRVSSLDGWMGRDCAHPLPLGGFPGLSRLPDALGSPASFEHFRGAPSGLLAHAPSKLVFDLEPGPHALGLRYGIGQGAYTIGATDGVVFSASLVDAGVRGADPAEQTLFERWLRPASVEADRGVQHFETSFEVLDTPGTLVLETGPGPAGDVAWDWSVWVEVSIDALEHDRSTATPSPERATPPLAP